MTELYTQRVYLLRRWGDKCSILTSLHGAYSREGASALVVRADYCSAIESDGVNVHFIL